MVSFEQVRGFLFDVDKTLTSSHRVVSQRTKLALQALASSGIPLGVCTGRHFTTLHQHTLPLFPKDALHVVSGGAQVIRSDGEILWEHCIPAKIVEELLKLFDLPSTRIYLQTGASIYGNARAIAEWTTIIGSEFKLDILPLSSLPAVGIPIIVMHEIDETQFQKMLTLGSIEAKWMKNYNGHAYADVTVAGVSKATGVLEWCRLQGIDPTSVVGIGDGENDTNFLATIGYPLAMGNATPALKAIATEVLESCDDDGVAVWVEKFLATKV